MILPPTSQNGHHRRVANITMSPTSLSPIFVRFPCDMVHMTFITSFADSIWWVTVMLVTSLCWWLYDGDWFQMLAAESLCWRLFSLCWWFSQCIKSVTNILNRSPTSQTCHRHIWSPTSVTNIDLNLSYTAFVSSKNFVEF